MAIAKNPKKTASAETKAKNFIHQSPNGSSNGTTTPKRELKDILIGFDRSLLERIDRAAQNMGLSRTAFVVSSAAEKVLRFEKEFLEARG